MPRSCEADAFYLGSVIVTRVYVGDHNQVWPCFDCSIPDVELLDPEYNDALMYAPQVCPVMGGPFEDQIKEKVSGIELTQGDAFNGVYSISVSPGDDATWGFFPPAGEEGIGEVIVEAELDAVEDVVGTLTSSVSFYIEISADIDDADDGLLIQVGLMFIHIIEYTDIEASGTKIRAVVPNPTIPDPFETIEVESFNFLGIDEETKVTVDYNISETAKTLSLYYNDIKVGETEVAI